MLKKKKHSSLNSCLFQALRASQITKVDLLQKAGTERGWKAPCCHTCRILLQAYLLPLTFQDHQCFTFTDVISDLQKNNPLFPLSFFDAQHRFLPLSSKHTRPHVPFLSYGNENGPWRWPSMCILITQMMWTWTTRTKVKAATHQILFWLLLGLGKERLVLADVMTDILNHKALA